jgi:hypothetical protein
VDHLLAVARQALPPPPPLADTETPRLALPAGPCVEALDMLLDKAREWLNSAADNETAESAYEDAWTRAHEALRIRVTDVMRGLGLLGGRASLPIPGPLSTQIATALLSTVLVVDPLADTSVDEDDEDGDDEDDEDDDEEDEDEDETPRPRIRGEVAQSPEWDDTPTPRSSSEQQEEGEDVSAADAVTPPPLVPAADDRHAGGGGGNSLGTATAAQLSQEQRFAQLLQLDGAETAAAASGAAALAAPSVGAATCALSCFAHDAPALWFGGGGGGGGGLSSICSEHLRLSTASQVAVLGASLLADWEQTRDDSVRNGLCLLAKCIATTRTAASEDQAAGGGGSGGRGERQRQQQQQQQQQRRWEWEVAHESEYQSAVLQQALTPVNVYAMPLRFKTGWSPHSERAHLDVEILKPSPCMVFWLALKSEVSAVSHLMLPGAGREHRRQSYHGHALPGAKNALLAPFYTKNTIILPRQARDKHRESTQNRGVFFTGAAGGRGRPTGP